MKMADILRSGGGDCQEEDLTSRQEASAQFHASISNAHIPPKFLFHDFDRSCQLCSFGNRSHSPLPFASSKNTCSWSIHEYKREVSFHQVIEKCIGRASGAALSFAKLCHQSSIKPKTKLGSFTSSKISNHAFTETDDNITCINCNRCHDIGFQ